MRHVPRTNARPGLRRTLCAVACPGAAVALAFGVEMLGVSAVFVLAPSAVAWLASFVHALARRRRLLPSKVAGVVLAAGLLEVLRPAPPRDIPPELAELLLRDLLSESRAHGVHYVDVDGDDPDPALLERLATPGIRLKPRSAALIRSAPTIQELGPEERGRLSQHNVVDRESGKPGVLLHIDHLTAEPGYLFSLGVDAGSYSGTLSAWGYRHVVMHVGRWMVTGLTKSWVS